MSKDLNKVINAIINGDEASARSSFKECLTTRASTIIREYEEDDFESTDITQNFDKRKGSAQHFTREIDETVKFKLTPKITAEVSYFGSQEVTGFESNETSDSPAWYEDTHRKEIKIDSVHAIKLNGEVEVEDVDLLKDTTPSMLLSNLAKYGGEVADAIHEFQFQNDNDRSDGKELTEAKLITHLVKLFATLLKEKERLD